MQRKRRNINFGNFSKSPGKYQKKFNNSITNTTLHSIPTVRMSERSNEKSLATPPETFCGEIVNSANVTWWASRKAALRAFHVRCFGKVRVNSTFLSLPRVFRIPSLRFGAVISTRPSQTLMVPFGGIKRSSENVIYTCASHVVMTPLSRIGIYLKLPLYIICTLLLSFVASGMMNGFECYAAVNPTASLSVSNPTLSTTVAPGDTAYLSSNVTYSASDIDSYSLQVSYANGYNSLKLDGGTTTLTGANGTSGSSLANNSWGFAWTNNTTNNDTTNAGLTYYTVPSYGTNGSNLSTGRLESATLPESANNTLSSTTKRIVFAAKFAENNNNSGHYKTGVQLSMVATPKKIIYGEWRNSNATPDGYDNATTIKNSGITTMQEMTSIICNQVSAPAAGSATVPTMRLKDSRDLNEYIIAKYADGRCWMTNNLSLKGSRMLTTSDSDVKSNYTLPALITSLTSTDFSESNFYLAQLYNTNSANSGNTIYYSWTAATAGAGASSTLTSGSVDTSICPKGWKLPVGGGGDNVEYYKLFNSIKNSSGASIYENDRLETSNYTYLKEPVADNLKIIQDLPYNFKYTGIVENGYLKKGTSNGYWWSNMAASRTEAYSASLGNSYVNPGTGAPYRYLGIPVRCIARDS